MTEYEINVYTVYVSFLSWMAQFLAPLLFPYLLPASAVSIISWRAAILLSPTLVAFTAASPLLGVLGLLLGIIVSWLDYVPHTHLALSILFGFVFFILW